MRAGSGAGVLGLAVAAGLLRSEDAFAQAWNKSAFDTKNFSDTVKALGGTGSTVSAEIRMSHEMETGQRKDSKGSIIPAHFIRNVTVTHAGKTVLSAQWGPAISKNPFMHFRFKGGKPGNKITITWIANKGESWTDEGSGG